MKSDPPLVEIAAFPPPMGSWSLRIEFVRDVCRKRGRDCVLLNIGSSRKLRDPRYLNIRGPFDFVLQVMIAAAKGCVLHTHTNGKGIKGTLLALCAQLISLVFGRKSVLTFHAGLKQEYFPKTGKTWLDLLMWLTFLTPRRIICNSEDVKRKIVDDYGIAAEKIHAIPAFCEEYMRMSPTQLAEPVREFLDNHGPVLVSYVYFFHAEFSVDVMVEAVARLRSDYPKLGLIIIGSQKYSEDYLPLIEERQLAKHILLTGNLRRDQFLSALKNGTLYLRTPMGDGVAASVLEALSLGTPVVASDNGTRPKDCILYRAGDVDDMVAKIRHVIENRARIAQHIVTPVAHDTLSEELDLLCSV